MISESLEGFGGQSYRGHERQRIRPFALPASGSAQEPWALALAATVHSCLVWLRTSYDELRKVARALGKNSTTIWKEEVNFLPGRGGEEGRVASGSHLLQADWEGTATSQCLRPGTQRTSDKARAAGLLAQPSFQLTRLGERSPWAPEN